MMSTHRAIPQWGYRIGRGFARDPEEHRDHYNQFEGFEPDEDHHEETEEEERAIHHHGQLRRNSHSKI